ncbi:thiamine phosphate synthase [Devosia sp.]|uniref:thiamine phosphate synthase n=1 Tax=Devosia sp. TaxID=1871048 RepID=UPI003A91157F
MSELIAELFLIAPADAAPEPVIAALEAMDEPAAALLLPRGSRTDRDYEMLVAKVTPVAQAAGTAVLIEAPPSVAKRLGVDGVHVDGDLEAVRSAVSALKPEMIVGAAESRTRHDAMQKGELDIDYILFGPLSGAISDGAREMAQWWAQTMQIPSVLADPEATLDDHDALGCEFIGLGLKLP